jgi:hypothetical protein
VAVTYFLLVAQAPGVSAASFEAFSLLPRVQLSAADVVLFLLALHVSHLAAIMYLVMWLVASPVAWPTQGVVILGTALVAL